ncbi:MAG: STAS domain-containing protein [Phycisphaeraceae bacterium]|nr:STAS domain-containing protein [Phycisphaeraceae bacterium]
MAEKNHQNLNTETTDHGLVVRLEADVDVGSSPTLRASLIQLIESQSPDRLVLDLDQVSFMDSSGVATLVETLRRQTSDGGELVLANMQPRVKGIFEISRLDDLFTIVSDIDAEPSA